jgi:Holliday junction resolvase RusA-like endonuclease
MCSFEKSDDESIRELATVLDLPVPPSVNSTRRIDYRSVGRVNKWKELADAAIWANGQFRHAKKDIQRYELHIVFDEKKCRLDLDNGVKLLIDYLRRINVVKNDDKKCLRRTVIEWGAAPEGVRITVKPLGGA